MKVEIELEYIEGLKDQIQSLRKSNKALEEKVNTLDEKELKQQARDLARKIFSDAMNRVFTDLGFEHLEGLDDINFDGLEHYLGKTWWNSDRLDITLGATITNQFRRAFLRMGIKEKDKQ